MSRKTTGAQWVHECPIALCRNILAEQAVCPFCGAKRTTENVQELRDIRAERKKEERNETD